jgi:alpha-1,3-glucosyltransferase
MLALVVALALALRVSVGLGPYSGAADPPRYGDFEAQRHWMELAIHLEPSDWYVNSTRNDLSWWGLDYPPLSGYQSWLHGKLLTALLLPEGERGRALALTRESRGFESPGSKLAMRAAVLASDAVVWFPCALAALLVFSSSPSSPPRSSGGKGKKKKEQQQRGGSREEGKGRGEQQQQEQRQRQQQQQQRRRRVQSLLWPAAAVLLQPALVLVDHGHFQFNGLGLGLSAAAAAAAASDWRILGSVLFTCALNHKQMALFFAPAFFGHLLGRCLESARRAAAGPAKGEKTKGARSPSSAGSNRREGDAPPPPPAPSPSLLPFLLRAGLRAAALGLAVALTMLALWWPVVPKDERGLPRAAGALAVLSRLAPVQRGIFEDYVANFWCASHPLFGWKRRFSREQLARMAAALTLIAAFPSTLHQILRPSKRGMLYCMACSSLAFFLFSYQVHEKSILLPLLPVSLLALGSEEGEVEEEEEEEEEEDDERKQEKKAATATSSLSRRLSAPPSERFLASWLPVAGCFSMWPLLRRDGLAWSYAGCLVLWIGAVVASRPARGAGGAPERRRRRRRRRRGTRRTETELALRLGPAAAVAGALVLHACHAMVRPPASLPWLWDAAITSYCSLFFFAAFAYLNLRMWFGSLEEGGGEREEQQGLTSTAKALHPRRAGPAAASSSRAKRD